MPSLDIVYVGGQYELVIENAGSVLLVDDPAVISTLANSMAAGIDTVVANAEFIFAGAPDAEMIASIFADTSSLLLEGAGIFDAGAATLLELLTDAGEALLAVLV